MALFLTIITRNLTYVTWGPVRTVLVPIFFLLLWLSRFGCVDSSGRGGAFLGSLSLILLSAVFLLVPPSFRGKLQVVSTRLTCCFWTPGLGFFQTWVFGRLGLSLGPRSVYRSIASMALLVKVPAGKDLDLSLGLGPEGPLIRAFQPSRSQPSLSIHSPMDGLRPL